MTGSAHKVGYMLLPILTVAVIAVTFAFNGLAATGPNAIFNNQTGSVSDEYYLEITPAGWTFSIWGIIYTWQMIWIIYGLSTICRQGIDGYLYYSPMIMPPLLYIVYWVNLGLNVTWLILWDRELMPVALVVIALLPVTLAICLFLSYRAVLVNTPALTRYGLTKEIWLIRWTVQNGMAFYATWTCIATLLNFGVVLAYWADMDQSTASTVSLSILAAEIVIWFLLDILVLDKYGVRYTFSPYLVVVWALAGTLEGNYSAGSTNTIFTIVLLVVGSLALIAKIVIMLYRHCTAKDEKIRSTLDEMQSTDKLSMGKY